MAGIGLRLNNRGLSLVETLVSVALISVLALAIQHFTVTTMTNIKVMRTEVFVKVFNNNLYQLFNSAQICRNTVALAGAIANGDAIANVRNRANTANIITFPMGPLNNGEITLTSMTIQNFANAAGNVRFNLAVTYRHNTFVPNQDMIKLIPVQGTVDAGLNIVTCQSGRGFNPDNLFIRLGTVATPVDETKIGNLIVIGDLEFLGNAGSPDRLRVTDPRVVALPPFPGQPSSVNILSDRELKENIIRVTVPDGIGDGMNAYRFNYVASEKRSIGFLAQEVQKKFPNSVIKSAEGTLAVNYFSLLPQVWEYHKKVYNQNLELEKRIIELQSRIYKLR